TRDRGLPATRPARPRGVRGPPIWSAAAAWSLIGSPERSARSGASSAFRRRQATRFTPSSNCTAWAHINTHVKKPRRYRRGFPCVTVGKGQTKPTVPTHRRRQEFPHKPKDCHSKNGRTQAARPLRYYLRSHSLCFRGERVAWYSTRFARSALLPGSLIQINGSLCRRESHARRTEQGIGAASVCHAAVATRQTQC